ncbi:MAG: glycerol-3-phosphate acyltransferase [Chloroflexota bacterium]|nr:glycerol-3-phosphate acyltransferase [Chloroflexota bacterium]
MAPTVTLVLVLFGAYLLGSIPSSYVIVRLLTGQDIRRIGSGNPGTMNVRDHVGWKPAIVVGVLDIGKGAAAVGLAYLAGLGDIEAILAGMMAVAGHDWSIFLRLHGGNGTGATVGALLALLPAPGLIAAVLAFVLWRLGASRRLSGLTGLLSVVPIAYVLDAPEIPMIGVTVLVSLLFVKLWRVEGFAVA